MATVTERRTRQQALCGAATLPDICLSLRAGLNGSADPLPRDDARAMLALLVWMLAMTQQNPVAAFAPDYSRRLTP